MPLFAVKQCRNWFRLFMMQLVHLFTHIIHARSAIHLCLEVLAKGETFRRAPTSINNLPRRSQICESLAVPSYGCPLWTLLPSPPSCCNRGAGAELQPKRTVSLTASHHRRCHAGGRRLAPLRADTQARTLRIFNTLPSVNSQKC